MGVQGPFIYSGAAQNIGAGFVVRQRESPGHRALIVYRTHPAPMGFPGGSYIVSLRIAVVPRNASPRELNLALGVAASINCATTFVPPKTGDVPLPRPGNAVERDWPGWPRVLQEERQRHHHARPRSSVTQAGKQSLVFVGRSTAIPAAATNRTPEIRFIPGLRRGGGSGVQCSGRSRAGAPFAGRPRLGGVAVDQSLATQLRSSG